MPSRKITLHSVAALKDGRTIRIERVSAMLPKADTDVRQARLTVEGEIFDPTGRSRGLGWAYVDDILRKLTEAEVEAKKV